MYKIIAAESEFQSTIHFQLQFTGMYMIRALKLLVYQKFYNFQAVSKWTEKNFDSNDLVNKMVNPDDLSPEGIWAREQAQILAQLIRVILSTGMFISGILGFVLDNTVPGNFNICTTFEKISNSQK